jgi:hypothetical protein
MIQKITQQLHQTKKGICFCIDLPSHEETGPESWGNWLAGLPHGGFGYSNDPECLGVPSEPQLIVPEFILCPFHYPTISYP